MDWSKLDLVVFAKDATTANGSVFLPGDGELHALTLTKDNHVFKLANDPLAGKVAWNIRAGTN
jgi:alpha-D-xyloside xylohydrolase